MRLSWNLVGWYKTSVRSIPRREILWFPLESAVAARLLKSWNRFTAYSFYAIELKLCRMIADITPYNHSELDFSTFFQGRCGCAPLWNLQIDSQSTIFIRFSWNLIGWYYHQTAHVCRAGFFISGLEKLFGRASCNLQIDSQPTVLMRLSWNLVYCY